MSATLIFFLLVLISAGFLLFLGIKPGLKKLPDALRWLRAHGDENSWIEFRHTASQYSIRFEKRYIAGVLGFVFVNKNKLTKMQIEAMNSSLRELPIVVVLEEIAANKPIGEIWFGDDIQGASNFAQRVAQHVLSLGRFTRYDFSFDIEKHMKRLLSS